MSLGENHEKVPQNSPEKNNSVVIFITKLLRSSLVTSPSTGWVIGSCNGLCVFVVHGTSQFFVVEHKLM